MIAAVGTLLVQLRDRFGRDVQPNQVEPSIEQRNKVAAVAAADIETSPQAVLAGGGHDVLDEADGRLVSEMPGRVRSVPRRCGVVIHNYEPKVPLLSAATAEWAVLFTR